jgi:transglutaminase-like putative cysteine protease
MTSLIKETLAEWTEGFDTRQSMISVFTRIRDIPYSVSVPMPNPKISAEQLLKAGKGSCGPKHYLLAEMFRLLNLNVVYATIAFSWNYPDLHYPSDLRQLAARLPLAYHLACRVQIGCRWVLVDATWDPPLARGGFLVNGPWDGYSEMKWAVKPLTSPAQPVATR